MPIYHARMRMAHGTGCEIYKEMGLTNQAISEHKKQFFIYFWGITFLGFLCKLDLYAIRYLHTTGTVISILLQKAENGRKVGLLWGA